MKFHFENFAVYFSRALMKGCRFKNFASFYSEKMHTHLT